MLVVALFAFWGMSNSLNDVLIPQFRKTFLLGDFASSFVQFATFIGYFVFAIPAALFMRRFGYRAAVVMGLVLFGTGALLFYPAAHFGEYHFFLGALFVVASGLSFLETSANPMIAAMGPAESADQRLNFAQTFNPLGTILGVFVGKELILSDHHLTPEQIRAMEPAAQAAWRAAELAAVKLPYLGIACVVLLWALLVAIAKFPPLAQRVAADDDCLGGRISRPGGVSALLAGRDRAVRLRRRAGGRVELRDPLHAVQHARHRREGRREQPDHHAHAVLRGPVRRHPVDVEVSPCRVAGDVRGRGRRALCALPRWPAAISGSMP